MTRTLGCSLIVVGLGLATVASAGGRLDLKLGKGNEIAISRTAGLLAVGSQTELSVYDPDWKSGKINIGRHETIASVLAGPAHGRPPLFYRATAYQLVAMLSWRAGARSVPGFSIAR